MDFWQFILLIGLYCKTNIPYDSIKHYPFNQIGPNLFMRSLCLSKLLPNFEKRTLPKKVRHKVPPLILFYPPLEEKKKKNLFLKMWTSTRQRRTHTNNSLFLQPHSKLCSIYLCSLFFFENIYIYIFLCCYFFLDTIFCIVLLFHAFFLLSVHFDLLFNCAYICNILLYFVIACSDISSSFFIPLHTN